MSDAYELSVRLELSRALERAKWQFREDKVRHLCWYLLEGRVTDGEAAIERAVELARELQFVDSLIKGRATQ